MATASSDATLVACVVMLAAAADRRAAGVRTLLALYPTVVGQLDPHRHRTSRATVEALRTATQADATAQPPSGLADRWVQVVGDFRLLEHQSHVVNDELAAARTRPAMCEHLAILDRIAEARADCLRRIGALLRQADGHLQTDTRRDVRAALTLLRRGESRARLERADLERLLEMPLAG